MKRNNKEIDRDYDKVSKAFEHATSLTELANATGLTKSQVKTTLLKKKMEELFYKNRKITKVAIDASATASLQIEEYLKRDDLQFVITSISLEEFSRLKTNQGRDGYWIRQILRMTQQEPERFILEKTPILAKGIAADNWIVEHCLAKGYTILTADKDMWDRAQSAGVNCICLDHDGKEILSIGAIREKHGKIVFHDCHATKWMAILVRDGKLIKNAHGKEVQIHDIIYRASLLKESVMVRKYEVIALSKMRNAICLDAIEIFNEKDIQEDAIYKDLVKEALIYL